jgi:hypothetical protein
MSLQVRRLHLATMMDDMPVHGYLVTHPGGAVLVLPGLSVVATPGHTAGHQSVVVSTGHGAEVLIGDAAYRPQLYLEPMTVTCRPARPPIRSRGASRSAGCTPCGPTGCTSAPTPGSSTPDSRRSSSIFEIESFSLLHPGGLINRSVQIISGK